MNASYKNFPFRLIGCALLLSVVGARTQSVKAVLPDPIVVEKHWRKNTKIFHETFEVLFREAEGLHFWGEGFPDWFKDQNGNLCKIETGSDGLSFHTLDDLEKLKCDAELKKIIKVLGSTEFLKKVLPEGVVESFFAHATGMIEEFRLGIRFIPCFKDAFFNPLNKGSLDMVIRLEHSSEEVMRCRFVFDFEKENGDTVLKNCDVSYKTSGDKISMEFLKKTNKLTDFPWSAAQDAKGKFSRVYKCLRDRFKNDWTAYCGRKIWLPAKNGKERYECSIGMRSQDDIAQHSVSMTFPTYKGDLSASIDPCKDSLISTNPLLPPLEKERVSSKLIKLYKTSAMLDVLATEDFWEGIFGETFWNIFKHYYLVISNQRRTISFDIAPCNDGLKISVLLENSHRGNMTKDAVSFYGSAQWEYLESNYIKFVFFYDPQKDEISHVRFQDRLILNDEIIQYSEGKDGLLKVTAEDEGEPDSFEKVLEKYGNHHTKASDSSHTEVSNEDPFLDSNAMPVSRGPQNPWTLMGRPFYTPYGGDWSVYTPLKARKRVQAVKAAIEFIGFGFCEKSQTSSGASSTTK